MVVSCIIEFDQNLNGTYYAGEIVSGTITLKCDKVKEVNAILLKISGRAKSGWTERHFSTRRTYHGLEEYLSTTTYLMGSENSSKSAIELGVHTYTFACQLPYDCPSSFEGLHGNIRYTVKVSLIRPWKFDQNNKRAFSVIRMTDLNFESPHIRIPSSSEAYKTYGCGPCTSEPLKLELKIPQAGYVPGQTIPVQALIINNTNLQVSEVNFGLFMIVRYISQSPKRTNIQRISVSKVKSEPVLRNCTRSLIEDIQVPSTPPTSIQSCGVIQIMYQVEIEVKVKGLHKNQVVTIPVIIGTVPLANNLAITNVIQQQPLQKSRDKTTDTDSTREDSTNFENLETPTSNIPPPTYEESVHMERNDINDEEEHSFGYCAFTPLYPVFNVPSPCFVETPKSSGGIDNRSFVS